jgi:hypothetical protein
MTQREAAAAFFRALRDAVVKQGPAHQEISLKTAKAIARGNLDQYLEIARIKQVDIATVGRNNKRDVGFVLDQIDRALLRIEPRRDRFYKANW